METYYFNKPVKLFIKEKSLVVLSVLDNKKLYLPLESIEKLVSFSKIHLTYDAIEELLKRKINVYFLNKYSFLGMLTFNLFSAFHLKQYESFVNHNKRINVAKKFILALYYNFNYYFKKKNYEINFNLEDVINALTIEELMGYESIIWKQVYQYLKENLKLKFNLREFHPPKDEVNALLSFLNSLLYIEIFHKGVINGFNMDISYLHSPKERALVFDIAEIYKPIVVIPLLIKLINQSIIREEHFLKEENKVYLNEKGRYVVVKYFKEKLNQAVYSKKLKNKHKIKHLILYEFYNLKGYLKGKYSYYDPFYLL
ncbi:MAG: CRISPR-associated endonuclease Cas1 [Nanoarchaeota archaeon]